MAKEPIIEFKNEEQAYECLKEWQSRLFLNDWIIKIILVKVDGLNTEWLGHASMEIEKKCASIRIVNSNADILNNELQKFCHERVLVHELLHLKYIAFEGDDSIEGLTYKEIQHSLLEQMAKSLIMAKYDLPFDWFKNF